MSDQVTRDDLEKAKTDIIERIRVMDASVEAMRSQNSAEHGSLSTKLDYITLAVRWLKSQWEKFTKP